MNKWKLNFFVITLLTCGSSYADKLVTDSVFSAKSFWYMPIPVNVQLHENSAAFVTEFLSQKTKYYGNVTINTYSYASPVYYAEAGALTTIIKQWDCQKKGFLDKNLAQQWSEVPIPSYAEPAKGRDAEMTIYQTSTDTLWEFWKMRKQDGKWEACWGGRMQNASKSDGVFPSYYGTTATSLPFIGGQITAEELQRGEIKHVIGISLVDLDKWSNYSWPAHRSDGWNPKDMPNRIPEGSRFRLDPSVDVDALKMSVAGKVIAKAAQKYGFVVWDKAGSISLRAQNPLSYTTLGRSDPYIDVFKGKRPYTVLDGFPWDRLQFLPKDYGRPDK
ncbi:MAG: DUF4124 domain-containing protein [Methylophilaceae bacterium]